MDRTAMLADMLERHLLAHPACVAEPEWYALADRAASALREWYQQVGAEHLTADENGRGPEHAGTLSLLTPTRARLDSPRARAYNSADSTLTGPAPRVPLSPPPRRRMMGREPHSASFPARETA